MHKLTAIAINTLARLRWIVPTVSIMQTVVFLVPECIPGIFGPAFVTEGVLPLRILAIAAALSMVLALTQTRLKHAWRHGRAVGVIVFALTLQVLLLVALVPEPGAPGAAVSFLAGITGLHLFMAFDGWGRPAEQRNEEAKGR